MADLLLSLGAGSRYRSIAADATYWLMIDICRLPATLRHADRVNFGPTVRMSNILLDNVRIVCGSVYVTVRWDGLDGMLRWARRAGDIDRLLHGRRPAATAPQQNDGQQAVNESSVAFIAAVEG